VGIVVALSGCRRLGPPEARAKVAVTETLPSGDVVPTEWGRLVSVSSIADYTDLVQLWFEDGGGAIRIVVFRVSTGELLSARRISRG
jgi:hypothetical protein